jgi:3D (Asp-Asp-Asp) domain-containing protein
MNKSLFGKDTDAPPLLMLSLATLSLVLNLCFPQYVALADTQKQKFMKEDGLEDKAIALNNAKTALVAQKEAENSTAIQEEAYSELKLEAKPVIKPKIKTIAQKTNGASSHWVTVTAYSSTADQTDASPFVTASGSHVRDGVIATNLLAFGTKVKFPSIYGDKVFTVEDRMNQRFSNRADIWFETREQAKQFGVRKLEMVIVS